MSYEADVIKEEMIGYMDAIIQRQDVNNLPKKMESFQIENAARRSLRDLMEHFELARKESNEQVQKLTKNQTEYRRRIEKLELQHKETSRTLD